MTVIKEGIPITLYSSVINTNCHEKTIALRYFLPVFICCWASPTIGKAISIPKAGRWTYGRPNEMGLYIQVSK